MNGSVFILSENSLYCSNDADFTIDRSIVMDENNKPVSSKHTQVIRVLHFMAISGELKVDDNVLCQMKFDSNEEVNTFSCTVTSLIQNVLILNIKARTLNHKEVLNTIKNKIKEEINHG